MRVIKEEQKDNYYKKYYNRYFTIYNRVYRFGNILDNDISISWSNDSGHQSTLYDLTTVMEFINIGLWDTITYERTQKIKKLLGGTI